jgi:hypothetical protein
MSRKIPKTWVKEDHQPHEDRVYYATPVSRGKAAYLDLVTAKEPPEQRERAFYNFGGIKGTFFNRDGKLWKKFHTTNT